jgi:hypothetical protein
MSLEGIKKLVDGGDTWKNDRGNTVQSRTVYTIQDRYFFDGKLCTRALGFEQFDTDQDAWYFGVWVNREDRATVTYAEGDLSLVVCASEESFRAEIADMENFYGEAPPMAKSIDADGTVTEYYDNRISAKELG